jgi:deoxycytidylate deaminase
MKTFLGALIVAIVGVIATGAAADPTACKECDPQGQVSSSSHREQIKAERAKYNRENEKVTARPWDVIKDDKSLPEKNK